MENLSQGGKRFPTVPGSNSRATVYVGMLLYSGLEATAISEELAARLVRIVPDPEAVDQSDGRASMITALADDRATPRHNYDMTSTTKPPLGAIRAAFSFVLLGTPTM